MNAGPDFEFRLHPKQGEAFRSPATEILYGGAAGGGKSHLFRVASIVFCYRVPGLQAYLFRRTYPELKRNHFGPGGYLDMLAPWIEGGFCRDRTSGEDPRIEFWHGSAIHFSHLQHKRDVARHRGDEIHFLLVDELTTFEEEMYRFLRSRVRMPDSILLPPDLKGLFPRIMTGSNPGGIGHHFVRRSFVDPAPEGEVWQAPPREGGFRRQFIRAKLDDNPSLDRESYAAALSGLGDEVLVRAMLEGDWDIAPGAFFSQVWRQNRHELRPFKLPKSWRLFSSFDWGSARPSCLHLWAEADGRQPKGGAETVTGERVYFPRGSLVCWGEWYTCKKDRDNEGLRLTNEELGAGVAERVDGHAVRGSVADPSIFSELGRPSIYQDMLDGAARWAKEHGKRHRVAFEEANNDRVPGWQRMLTMLRSARDGDRERPGLWFFDTCRHALRTLPVIPRSERHLDDVDTDAEDHAADSARYAVMSTSTRVRRRPRKGGKKKPAPKKHRGLASELGSVEEAIG